LAQRSIKRFLAFSSIVNLGYLLILLSTLSAYNIVFAFAYLISYFINLIVLFILILLLNKFTGYKELKITEINQLSNIFKTNPVIAILFAIVLFSIGGLPPFGGFYTKYFILVDLANNSLFFIIFLMLILSIVSTFYYIRIIKIIFFNKELLDNKTEFYYKNQNNVVNVTSGSNFVVIYFLLCLALFLLSLNIIIIFYPGLLFYPLFLLFL
jgi:NADH-quinone oxidoreductase subunit N